MLNNIKVSKIRLKQKFALFQPLITQSILTIYSCYSIRIYISITVHTLYYTAILTILVASTYTSIIHNS